VAGAAPAAPAAHRVARPDPACHPRGASTCIRSGVALTVRRGTGLACASMGSYGRDVLAGDWRRRRPVPEVDAEPDLVVEDAESGFCGAVVGWESGAVTLEDRHGRRRHFPLLPAAFLLDGELVTLRRPAPATDMPTPRPRTASGSVAVADTPARVARASRIWKEGVCEALGISDPYQMWRRVLTSVRDFRDLETPLLGAVERLIDFVTVDF